MSELKRTPLYDVHVAAGASMVDFGGWDMPIQYPEKIVAEHLFTRAACSLFDVSHMGHILVSGPDRLKFLQRVLTSNVAALEVGMSQYCIISDDNGRAIDDAYAYRFEEDRYLVVINASNTDKDLAHFNNVIKDYDKYTLQECYDKGINESMIHVDFMIGTEDLSVTAITRDGKRVPVFENGNWAF